MNPRMSSHIELSTSQLILKIITLGLSAALFGLLLLVAFWLTARMTWPLHINHIIVYRYDILLMYAVIIQIILIIRKLETRQEVFVIAIFHIMAMLMELFLTSPAIGSWQYPEAGLWRINNVPLFAGFMYSAVGSFLARSLRLFNIQFFNLPSLKQLGLLALLAYINFFTHHFIMDMRWLLLTVSIYLFYNTVLTIHLSQKNYRILFLPILLGLALIVWIAENVATFSHIWLYPSQVAQWHWVGLGKVTSWYLLLLLSLVLVLVVMGQRDVDGTWRLKG